MSNSLHEARVWAAMADWHYMAHSTMALPDDNMSSTPHFAVVVVVHRAVEKLTKKCRFRV